MATDLLERLFTHLTGTDMRVYAEDLPHGFEKRGLPVVLVHRLGASARWPALNGLGVDVEDYEVELFVSPQMWDSGEAHDRAHALRDYLSRFPPGDVRIADVSRPARRPDYNPAVRVLAMTLRVLVPA